MSSSRPAQPVGRRVPAIVLAVVAIAASLFGVVGCRSVAGPTSSAAPTVAEPSVHSGHERLRGAVPDDPPGPFGVDSYDPLGIADGEVPEGVTVFDAEYPAVAKLDPELLGALRSAASDAADDGVELHVNSGWRSAAYQGQLLREAIAEYGSEEAAARWVATAETSPHVSGDAIDIGPSDATSWLSAHGAAYGLCQPYANEPWHFELRPDAIEESCPAMYPDPTHDPRMQR